METTGAKLLHFRPRADASPSVAQTDEAVMDQTLAERTRGSNRRLRNLIILANALAWVVIAFVLHAVFSDPRLKLTATSSPA